MKARISLPDLKTLVSFLEREKFQEAYDTWQNYFMPTVDRVDNHTCISDCRVVSLDNENAVLECSENAARFREADRVLLNPAGTSSEKLSGGFQMDWLSFDPLTMRIHLEKSFASRRENFPFKEGDILDIDVAAGDLQEAVAGRLTGIRDTSRGGFLEDYLQGRAKLQPVSTRPETRDRIVKLLGLNPAQTAGFDLAISTYPVSAIQGPPGSGKTWVLAALVCYYLSQGIDVVISAVSHFAINNALNSVSECITRLGLDGHAVKVSRSKNSGLDRGVIKTGRISGLGDGIRDSVNAWGMTYYKFRFELKDSRFKLLILDEASQASLPLAVAAMSHFQKTILIGDHQQMRPIINYPLHERSCYRSIFEHHVSVYPEHSCMLNETFRLNRWLNELPSRLSYDGKLKPSETAAERLMPFKTENRDEIDRILDPSVPGIYVSLDHRWRRKSSEEEALLTTALISRAVLDYDVDPADIAVLVPFRAQQGLIRRHLHHLAAAYDRNLRPVLVDTVERMQGQERPLVIYSLTSSDPISLARMADTYFDPRRFNVALTRASRKRIVIASRYILETRPSDPSTLSAISTFAEFFSEEQEIPIKVKLLEKWKSAGTAEKT